jgi:hypothetical protein
MPQILTFFQFFEIKLIPRLEHNKPLQFLLLFLQDSFITTIRRIKSGELPDICVEQSMRMSIPVNQQLSHITSRKPVPFLRFIIINTFFKALKRIPTSLITNIPFFLLACSPRVPRKPNLARTAAPSQTWHPILRTRLYRNTIDSATLS